MKPNPRPVLPEFPALLPARYASLLAGVIALGLPFAGGAAEPAAKTDAPANATETEKTAPEAKDATEEKPADAAAEAAPGDFRNWFNVSVGGMLVDGDKAAAQRRWGVPASAFGGVEEFHFEKDLSKTAIFKIDGRGIFDNDDYRLRLEYNDSEKGFIRGGVDQLRHYSDPSGGWFPGNNRWFELYPSPFELVRGSAFFEAGLRKPKIPEFTIRYEHQYREGTKDSTIWGDSALTGGAGVRAFLPTFSQVDERTDVIAFDVKHTLGKATFGAGFSYQKDDLDNARYLWRRPGEISERKVTQTETVQRDIYSARAFVDTIFNEHFRLSTAYLFTTLDANLGGSRIVGSDFDPIYDPVYGRRDVGFLNLSGFSELDQHVWNVNLMWTPIPNLSVIPAFRVENQTLDGSSSWTETGAQDVARNAANSRDMVDLSQQLEVRYTGVTNVVMYVRGDWVQGDGNLLENQFSPTARVVEIRRDSDFERFSQKYTAGAHWYPLRQVNLHAQYYRKMRESRYDENDPVRTVITGAYPGFIEAHDFTTDDVNFRVTWRPLDKVTFTSRYDFQINTVDLRGAGLGSREASHGRAQIFGETITWTPVSRIYVQPGINYVLDSTESGATSVAGSASPVATAKNDYFNVTCTVGVVLDDKTDLQTTYSYYLADNYDPALAAYSLPFGAGAEEHGVSASLIRRISPKLRVSLRYGFFTSRNATSGGFDDYDAHMVQTSAQYLF